ncbi:MAG TPA: hypothetical protein VLB81_01420 [Gaiellales bacterium]|nr:hypothetical protein [Gaiellales bacterium]
MEDGIPGYGDAVTSKRGTPVLVTILIILAIIALALFIWRNMASRRV